MKILSNIENLDILYTTGEYYFQNECVKIEVYQNSIAITDLENALARGKSCYSVGVSFGSLEGRIDFKNFMVKHFNSDFMAFINHFIGLSGEFEYCVNFKIADMPNANVCVSKEKGTKVFSPFATSNLKPLKSAPKKWTIPNVVKALINGQFENLTCDGCYTDDYAFDAAYNFQKGQIAGEHALNFAKKIIERPSAYGCYTNNPTSNIVNIYRGSDDYSFKFVVSPTTK